MADWPPDARAQGANSGALASLQAQIRRYGCHLPQYANSVAGCRNLNARLRALQSGRPSSRSANQPYGQRPYRPRQQPPSSGSFFSGLFGGGSNQRRGTNTARYSTYSAPNEGGLSGYSRSYGSNMHRYGNYRTLCVRTCDGYYWPMSFSTSRGGIARDANQCRSSCSAPARLFYHRNPGADVQHMVDLQGKPYVRLENAFRYRKEYVKDCRCKPQPWSEQAEAEYERRETNADNPDAVKLAANKSNTPVPLSAIQFTPATMLEAPARGYQPRFNQNRTRRRRNWSNSPSSWDQWRDGSW